MAYFGKLSQTAPFRHLLCAAALLGTQLFVAPLAHGQTVQTAAEYPSKPIKIVVGFAPGGGSDFIARIVAQRLTAKLGQTVYVENRPGAGGNLGAEIALRSAGDGYTLFLAATSYTVNANLYKLPFDAVKDITAVARLASGPFVIATNPGTQIKTLKELVERAKSEPGKLTYASSGSGSITHIATEYFLSVAGVEALHIPYKGTSPALTDTISGTVQFMFGTVASTVPHVKSGKLHAVAVSSAQRASSLPDVPTFIENGLPDFDINSWVGLLAPAKTPKSIVDKLNTELNAVLNDPAVRERLNGLGITASPGSAEKFGQDMQRDLLRYGAVVKAANIKAD